MPRPLIALIFSAGLTAATLLSASVTAQAPLKSPTDSQQALPEQGAQPDAGIAGPGPDETLSEHLDRTEGVLVPKGNPDPGIAVAPPDAGPGTMPVIPPPGASGGDPDVRPK